MREGIHPKYYQAKVVCNCGNEFVTGSTKDDIHVEICSKCHSFYTGQQKAAKARGRIDKFNRDLSVVAFSFPRKNISWQTNNAPQESHCGGKDIFRKGRRWQRDRKAERMEE